MELDEDIRLQTACFTGHRFIAASAGYHLIRALDQAILDAAARGVTRFLCGGAIGFDMLAAQRVLAIRKARPEISLIMVIPCENQSQNWRSNEKQMYAELRQKADECRVLSPFYYQGCMQVRNRYMVDRSCLCIAYLIHGHGGTSSTVSYAMENGVKIVNLAMEPDCAPDDPMYFAEDAQDDEI